MNVTDYLTGVVPTWSPAYDDPTFRALVGIKGDPYAPAVPMTPATGVIVRGEVLAG